MNSATINTKINKAREPWQGGREAHAKVKQMKPELKRIFFWPFVSYFSVFLLVHKIRDLNNKRRKIKKIQKLETPTDLNITQN